MSHHLVPTLRDSPRRLLLPVLAFSQLIITIDYDIVLVALPRMKDSLGFSTAGLQWVVSAYALAFGGTLLFCGRFTDLFGRRRGIVAGLALYGVGTLAAAAAFEPALVLAGRVAQGLGGALLTPAVLAMINISFEDGPARFRALSVWSGAGAVGLAAGSALGGVLTSAFGWRAVFGVNVPLVALALAGILVAAPPDDRSARRRPLDVPGAVLATVTSVAVVLALAEGSARGWTSTVVLVSGAIGLIGLALFVAVEHRAPAALLPLGLLRGRALSVGVTVMALFLASIGTSYYVLTIFLQDVLGISALGTGLAFLPWGVAAIGGSQMSRLTLSRLGVHRALVISMLVAAAGTAGLASTLRAGEAVWVPLGWTVPLGVGQAMGFASLFAAAATGVEAGHQGITSALMSTFQQIGNAVGLSLLAGLAASIAAAGAPSAHRTALGLRTVTWIAAAVLVVGAAAAVLTRPRAQRRPGRAEPSPCPALPDESPLPR
jgi:MFS family permease